DGINDCFKKTKYAGRGLSQCPPELRDWIKDVSGRAGLIAELMNECSCVVDAENIRKGTPAAETYLREQRDQWQMPLQPPKDKMVVLDIHERYCAALEASHVLSMGQMIADFNRYMFTYEWWQLRE